MSGSTPVLGLKTAVDSDDTADYLTLNLSSSLTTVDGLFSSTTGHSHSGAAAQGGPLSSIPGTALLDGAVTSAKIADGTIVAADIAANGITQMWWARGLNTNPTTTSVAYVDLDGNGSSNQLRVDMITKGGDLLVWLRASLSNSSAAGLSYIALTLDGAVEVADAVANPGGAGLPAPLSTMWVFTGVAAGSHNIRGRWSVSTGTGTSNQTYRSLIVLERLR
jgi:hypothetical protein